MSTNKIIMLVGAILVVIGLGIWLTSTPTVEAPKSQIPTEQITPTPEQGIPVPPKSTTTNINNTKIMNAILHTTKGDITIKFTPDATPKTVANFIKLAQEGFYNNTKFHRVIKGFMNQGGDPLSKDDSQAALWGTGDPGYKFDDEITSQNKNVTGSISMANSGPNTNGSQFFINAADNNFLDTKHTVFGNVIEGLDVVMAINSVATDAQDRPIEPVAIKSITLK
ncbi:MAG: peptidylprolyl isomerase [Candidatus Paceibacterota bacterium]